MDERFRNLSRSEFIKALELIDCHFGTDLSKSKDSIEYRFTMYKERQGYQPGCPPFKIRSEIGYDCHDVSCGGCWNVCMGYVIDKFETFWEL